MALDRNSSLRPAAEQKHWRRILYAIWSLTCHFTDPLNWHTNFYVVGLIEVSALRLIKNKAAEYVETVAKIWDVCPSKRGKAPLTFWPMSYTMHVFGCAYCTG